MFSGFARDATNVPVRYPAAPVPQAWAAAAPLLCLRELMGLDAAEGRLSAEPLVEGVALEGLPFRGERVDVP